jgi:MFS family permease
VYITLRRRPAVPAGADGGGADVDDSDASEPGGPGSNVVALGFTSLFTDVSSEMVVAVLPLYLTFQLRFTPAQFGVVDGLAQAVTALTLLAGAVVADRTSRYKEVAATGYAASAGCKIGLLAAGSAWIPTTGLLLVDRTAKGLRTPPRDALISMSARPGGVATAFGVHRTLDTIGALLGPFAAFLLLFLAPGSYGSVFVVSFIVALVGLAVLAVFVEAPPHRPLAANRARRPAGAVRDLLANGRLRRVLAAAAILNVLTVSDAFIYLTLQHRSSFQTRYFPLLFAGTALAYLVLAIPAGRLADRIGSPMVLVSGYVLLLGAYGMLLMADPGPRTIIGALMLLGAYYASTDGVLMALASSAVSRCSRATGLAIVATVVAASRLVSSVVFGALWGRIGPRATVVVFVAGLVAVLPLVARLLSRPRLMGAP